MKPIRLLIVMILIAVTAAAILIAKIMDYEEEDLLAEITEPLTEEVSEEVKVMLPVIVGPEPMTETVNELVKEPEIDEEELDLLARLIQAEAGADWCSDELQKAVGSVVINRMNDSRYPSEMRDVIYQDGQYSTAKSGKINQPATDRAKANAEYLLKEGVTLPEEIVFQANFRQGKVFTEMQGVYFGE
jgi:spore germination cell wall hydrolase CwlJ-like protein